LKEIPVLNSTDTIYFIQKRRCANHDFCFFAAVLEPDNKLLIKSISTDFIDRFVSPTFILQFNLNTMENANHWCYNYNVLDTQEKNDPCKIMHHIIRFGKVENYGEMIALIAQNIPIPIYEYIPPTLSLTISHLKCEILYSTKSKTYELDEFHWSISPVNQNLATPEYEKMTNCEVEEIFGSTIFRLLRLNTVEDLLSTFGLLNNTKTSDSELKEMNPTEEDGKMNSHFVYFILRTLFPKFQFHYNITHQQICELQYNSQKQIYYAIQGDPDSKGKINYNRRVILSKNYVEEQSSERIKEAAELRGSNTEKGKNKFVKIGQGDIRNVEIPETIFNNPIIQYPQGMKDICVFSCFSSALHFMGFVEWSKLIFSL
jgi:hypothetical protein